jgi:hypothetical protein
MVRAASMTKRKGIGTDLLNNPVYSSWLALPHSYLWQTLSMAMLELPHGFPWCNAALSFLPRRRLGKCS